MAPSSRPPMAGPTARATLKLTLFSSTALPTCARGTCSPTAACQAGVTMALPMAMQNTDAISVMGCSRPAKARMVMKTPPVSSSSMPVSMTLRRS